VKPMKGVEANMSKLVFPYYVSPKIDGIRCLIINGKAVTRALKPIPNHHIRESLESSAFVDLLEGFDGEIIVGDPTDPKAFNTTTSAVMSREGKPNFTFLVFDRFAEGVYSERFIEWTKDKFVLLPPFVKLIDQYLMTSQKVLDIIYEEFIARGYEGAMLRTPNSPYKQGRSTLNENYLLKLKPFEDDEAFIVGYEEQFANTNEATINELGYTKRSSKKEGKVGKGVLGALVVKSKRFEETFKVSSGFDDAMRALIWDNKSSFLGKQIKYKYQKYGMLNVPRIPTFLGFRADWDM
jgi:DNA ligase-1